MSFRPTKGFILFLISFVVIIIGVVVLLPNVLTDDTPLDVKNTRLYEVDIASGSTSSSIGLKLERSKIIKSKDNFKILAGKMGANGKMQAAKYLLSPSMKPSEIIGMLVSGQTNEQSVKVVIPEGYSVKQIINRLVESGLGTKEAYLDVLSKGNFKYEFLEGIDKKYNLEGFLFPATYSFKKNSSEHDIIDRMLMKFDLEFKASYYDRAKELGMTVNEAITLSSIIEKEAKLDRERKIVSSVFINRIKVAMPLQSCATVQFVLGTAKPVLSYADIAIDSPYNTYKNPGLPPAPIASPGIESIEAALYPDKTEFLYFVVTNLGDGSSYFAKTYDEHKANIIKSNANSNK